MGTLFKLKRANREIEAFLKREERRRAERVEAFAIEALQLGVAFADGPGPGDEGDGGPAEEISPVEVAKQNPD